MSFSHCCMVEYAWQKHQHASPSPFKFNKYINIETESKFSSVTRTIALKSVQLKDILHLLIHLELILSTLFFFFSFSDNQQSPGGHVTFRENMCLALALAHAFYVDVGRDRTVRIWLSNRAGTPGLGLINSLFSEHIIQWLWNSDSAVFSA